MLTLTVLLQSLKDFRLLSGIEVLARASRGNLSFCWRDKYNFNDYGLTIESDLI